jgi:hypothetical protein
MNKIPTKTFPVEFSPSSSKGISPTLPLPEKPGRSGSGDASSDEDVDSGLFAGRVRFLMLALTTVCLTLAMCNGAALHFTVICMKVPLSNELAVLTSVNGSHFRQTAKPKIKEFSISLISLICHGINFSNSAFAASRAANVLVCPAGLALLRPGPGHAVGIVGQRLPVPMARLPPADHPLWADQRAGHVGDSAGCHAAPAASKLCRPVHCPHSTRTRAGSFLCGNESVVLAFQCQIIYLKFKMPSSGKLSCRWSPLSESTLFMGVISTHLTVSSFISQIHQSLSH